MMVMNKMGIAQENNIYGLYLPPENCVCKIIFPPDHQYAHDAKALEVITKALAERWGLIGSKTNRNS